MKSTIRLFKAVPINTPKKKPLGTEANLYLKVALKKGFILSPEVLANTTVIQQKEIIKTVSEELVLSARQMNEAFHKSWNKIRTASMEQLVIEQIVHYITTYGFEKLGIFSHDSVFIPKETLKIPPLRIPDTEFDGLKLMVIKGYTKEELKEKLIALLGSGIALKDTTITDILDVATFVELGEEEIHNIKNKEVKVALYDYLNLVPKNPTEFLRYAVFKATEKTLLIKNPATIEAIKARDNFDVLGSFAQYKKKYGLEPLASIFNRFKPLFLAFRGHAQMNAFTNKIRKLAKIHHKPMPRDYLNDITAMIKSGQIIDKEELKLELSKVNIFRKIRLAYALKFRTTDAESILYRIRNGKSFATEFTPVNKKYAQVVLDIVLLSIAGDMSKNLSGKKIFLPRHLTYTLPATEKQFVGNFPSGSFVSVPNNMVFGVHWENVDDQRVDLDMSLINVDAGKIGWDSSYRNDGRSILFSGDITDAPKPKGATELFYVSKHSTGASLMCMNYYNYDAEITVPFKIFVAKEEIKNMRENYMVDPNSVKCVCQSQINTEQMILGLALTDPEGCKFFFTEASFGVGRSSGDTDHVRYAREYLVNYYLNSITLTEMLLKSGAEIVTDVKDADIDLSPESLEKDTIINLLVEKQ